MVSEVLGSELIPRGEGSFSATCLFARTLQRGLPCKTHLQGRRVDDDDAG
jgi:hypothetical protein